MGCAPSTPSASSGKRIALTYDDAPLGAGPLYSGTERTRAFIEQLGQAETGPVAMFVTTRGLSTPEGRQRIFDYAQAGHLIANHSDTHMWASRTPTAEYIADIDTAEAKLVGFPNRRPWFRFPFLDEGGMGQANRDFVRRDKLRAALTQRSLKNGYVTIDTYDWHLDRLWKRAAQRGDDVDMTALSQVYVDMVLEAAAHYDALGQEVLERRPAQVLLLHENDLAARFTKDLVTALRADGWVIISPDEAFSDPLAAQIPKTGFSGMGRISAAAADAGLRGEEVYNHWSADEAGIDTRVSDAGVFTPGGAEAN